MARRSPAEVVGLVSPSSLEIPARCSTPFNSLGHTTSTRRTLNRRLLKLSDEVSLYLSTPVGPDKQWQLCTLFLAVTQRRSLHERPKRYDLLGGHRELEFERADQSKHQGLHPAHARWVSRERQLERCRRKDALDEGEPVPYARMGTAEEGQQVAPYARNGRDALGRVLPSLRP